MINRRENRSEFDPGLGLHFLKILSRFFISRPNQAVSFPGSPRCPGRHPLVPGHRPDSGTTGQLHSQAILNGIGWRGGAGFDGQLFRPLRRPAGEIPSHACFPAETQGSPVRSRFSEACCLRGNSADWEAPIWVGWKSNGLSGSKTRDSLATVFNPAVDHFFCRETAGTVTRPVDHNHPAAPLDLARQVFDSGLRR